MSSKFDGSVLIQGTLTVAQGFNAPAGSIKNADIKAAAGIEASKLQHQHALNYQQADGSAVAAAIVPIHIVRGVTATVIDIEVACVDAPSGGDLAFSVDLLKADEDTPAPASVLSAAVPYSATQNDCEVEAGTITTPALVVGDQLLIQVAVSGSTGTQGQGLIVTVTIREDAE